MIFLKNYNNKKSQKSYKQTGNILLFDFLDEIIHYLLSYSDILLKHDNYKLF